MEKITTMNKLAEYINSCEDFPIMEVEEIIEQNGWVSDTDTEWGVCHNDTQKVIMNDEGKAQAIYLSRGGWRDGGRPKIEGKERRWIIPQDILDIIEEKGKNYIWDAIRFKYKLDSI